MSIFKRAFLYIVRKPVRSIILALILFAMGLLMLAGISIRTSAATAAEEVRQTMTSGFDLKIKDGTPGEKIFEGSTNEKGEFVRKPKIKLLTQDGLNQIMEVDGIKGYFGDVGSFYLYTGLDVFPGLFTEEHGKAERAQHSKRP